MGGVHGGKFAVVDNVSTVRNWSITETMTPAKSVASNTGGGTARRSGVSAWTGKYDAYGHTPYKIPGESFTFTGFTAPADDVSTPGDTWTGTVIVDSVVITWDWKAGTDIAHTVNFSGSLTLSVSTAAVITDATDPELFPICGVPLKYIKISGTVSTDTVYANISQAVLTLSATNQSYVNSSTACGTGRKAGPIDWSLQVTEETSGQHADIVKGAEFEFKLFVDAVPTNCWDLKNGIVEGFTNLNVDRETGAIISRTVNISMQGVMSNGDLGFIKKPGATTVWPPA